MKPIEMRTELCYHSTDKTGAMQQTLQTTSV